MNRKSRRDEISGWSIWGYLPVLLALCFVWREGIVFAQNPASQLRTGKEIFQATCVACHGVDGKGTPETVAGFTRPNTFPDFTDCNGTAREPNVDWKSIIHMGGPQRGFSQIMPSFTEALTPDQVDKVVDYLRSLCTEPKWPRGELNLPRAMVTDKAYPEDETVLTTGINTTGPAAVTNTLTYERRIGARNQIEVSLPFATQKQASNTWFGGVGDLTLGFKRNLFSSIRSGSIFSVSGEANLPTGNQSKGLGSGVTIFETFVTYGQILPKQSFVQVQSGVEVPTHHDNANNAVFARTAVGKSFREEKGLGRLWTPMVEFLMDREIATGEKTNWDLLPQFQVTLSRRQHIRANIGIRFPINNTVGRSTQLLFYVLWDWFDGGLREGWR